MNRRENPQPGTEAQLRYTDSDFQVVRSGAFVRCAVTGMAIPLEELRYWSAARQEPYADARAAGERERQIRSGVKA
ncbi:MAG: DUF2093 domain-containing protein [Rhodobiaceae bacterium]|nr:DUF2093 domain-containing protein [Rhodobiaceae bacterium]MCC0015888.1 DUF2093 domain-containing protein [Rhodobiaceae bacterium]MCC0040673.1 DUF2093 domain-containing protein [Rhodobiaceae bacterium]